MTNYVIYLHGVMLEREPGPAGQVYDEFHAAVLEGSPRLESRIKKVIRVRWGRPMAAHQSRDAWLNQAQARIAGLVDYQAVASRPDPERNRVRMDFPAHMLALLRPFWRSLRQDLFLHGLGDLIFYTAIEGRLSVQLNVYGQILQELEAHRERGSQDRIRLHLVAHSLGAGIAADFLAGLFEPESGPLSLEEERVEPILGPLEERERETIDRFRFWRESGRLELGSLVTMAAPLPILLQGDGRAMQVLRQEEGALDPARVGIGGQEVTWSNFYDIDDLLAYPARPLFGNHPAISDVQVDTTDNPLTAHTGYWACREVRERVARLWLARMP